MDETGDPTAVLIEDEETAEKSHVMSKLDLSPSSSGLRLGGNTTAKLKALLEISQSLRRALAMKEVLPKLLDSLFAIFTQADRGFLVLRDPLSERLIPMAVKHRRSDDREMIRISRTIVNNVMAGKEGILSADAANDARFALPRASPTFTSAR